MKLNLSSKEMEIILSLTANASHLSKEHHSLWRKVSHGFVREFNQIRALEGKVAHNERNQMR
jgi:predicted thioredoxin/glutaredoxin